MKPKLNQKHLSLILTTFAVLRIPACFCQNDELYQTCSHPFHCGRVSHIGYPFYGGSQPASCGYPGFEIDCLGDELLLNISSIIYRVLSVDNKTQTLIVSRNDLRDSVCPTSPHNTTLNFNLFDFYSPANDQNITLYYGCSVNQKQPFVRRNQFDCDVNGTNSLNFFVTREAAGPGEGVTCNSQISARVNQTAALDLANDTITSRSLLEAALKSGFTIQWLAENDKCNSCVRSGGLCGYDQDSTSFACHCTNGSYVSTCNGPRIVKGSGKRLSDLHKYVIIGVSLGIAGLVISSIVIYHVKCRLCKDGLENNQNIDKFLVNHESLAPKRYSYNEIKKITKFFTEKLGQGGNGIVYRGNLPDGQPVAVKVLIETHDNAEEFVNEVASISRTSHVNIVNLLGFCFDKKKRALVYEFMPNKSLDRFIYKNGFVHPECPLEWEKLYNIAIGVARGLEYLHRGCNTRIVHFDIKPQNILLGEDFCPKISDFGLAKLFREKQSIMSTLGTRGTIGYIAPEVFSRTFGIVSHKSDVYSYGMMLLEIAETGKFFELEATTSTENYFFDKMYAHILHKSEELDDLMTEKKEETVRKMLIVGLWCVQTAPSDRPSMTKVVEMLEGSLQSIQIPPKPFLDFPTLSGQQFSSSFSVNVETETPSEG